MVIYVQISDRHSNQLNPSGPCEHSINGQKYIIVFNVMHYIFAWNETEIFLAIPINTLFVQ